MVIENNLKPIINQQKLVEEVREIEESSWWKEYQSSVVKSSLSPTARSKVINKSGSGYVSERGKEGYGPMPVDRQALMIAGSDSIMSRIRTEFPNVARLLDEMPEATLGFLRSKCAFSAYLGRNAFEVPCSHEDNYSKNGVAAWTEYHEKIKQYVSKICQRTPEIREHYEKLRQARVDLAKYIWDEYYKILPYWPSVGGVNERSFEANKNGSYENSGNHIVWNCLGWVDVKDERPAYETFIASFSGSPEIKLLILDLYRMRRIENGARSSSANFENLRREIRDSSGYYGGLIDWKNF